MPTPPKPFTVLQAEKKSHRTKKELNQRKKEEESLSTGIAMKVRPEVKSNPLANKEFKRVNMLLKNIGKNDAIHENVINRYCLLVAECEDLLKKKEHCYSMIKELHECFQEEITNTEKKERGAIIRDYMREYNGAIASLFSCDAYIQSKRKMLLDIEKENIMTIAAALRSIPKKTESKSNVLLEALSGGD